MIVRRRIRATLRCRFGFVSFLGSLVLSACAAPLILTEAERSEFDARARELEQRLDPIEVEDPDSPPAAPAARIEVQPEPDLDSAVSRDETAEAARLAAPVGLAFHIFNAGQADSMLVIGPAPEKKTLLIDLGEDRSRGSKNYRRVASRLRQLTNSERLDYLLVSHYHADHIGDTGDGIAGLVDGLTTRFKIGTLIDVGKEAKEFMKLHRNVYDRFDANVKRWLQEGTVERREKPRFGTGQIHLGPGVKVEILAFAGRVHKNDKGALDLVERNFPGRYRRAPASENDLSIALEISYKDFELFTAGDLTGYNADDWNIVPLFTPRQFGNSPSTANQETYTNVESHLVKRWKATGRESDVEVYRANHHGSRFSSCPMLLEALDPEFILFSTGGGHGHPDGTVVRRSVRTAKLMATTEVAQTSSDDWNAAQGKIRQEISIRVAETGKTYTIEGNAQKAFTDAEERQGMDQPSP